MATPNTTLAARLRDGATVYGCFVELPCAEAVEIVALSGFDFCVVDSEHAPIGPDRYADMVRAAECRGMEVIVRVPENRGALVQQALDAGAAGVLVPQVGAYESALTAVASARFFPEGRRGVNGFVRASRYSARSSAEYLAQANSETVCALQLESANACKDAGRIASIPGVDVLFVGPWDLSQSLGVPGETSHPDVLAHIDMVLAACQERKIAAGIYANTPADGKEWAARGFHLITCLVDSVILLRGLQDLRRMLS